jgi:hypothetical protein
MRGEVSSRRRWRAGYPSSQAIAAAKKSRVGVSSWLHWRLRLCCRLALLHGDEGCAQIAQAVQPATHAARIAAPAGWIGQVSLPVIPLLRGFT